jgi:hypothetical protein
MITDYRGSALGPVQRNVRALALIDENPNASSNVLALRNTFRFVWSPLPAAYKASRRNGISKAIANLE